MILQTSVYVCVRAVNVKSMICCSLNRWIWQSYWRCETHCLILVSLFTHMRRTYTLTHLNVAQKPIIWDMVIVTSLNWQSCAEDYWKDNLSVCLDVVVWAPVPGVWLIYNTAFKASKKCWNITFWWLWCVTYITICLFMYAHTYLLLKCACICVRISGM